MCQTQCWAEIQQRRRHTSPYPHAGYIQEKELEHLKTTKKRKNREMDGAGVSKLCMASGPHLTHHLFLCGLWANNGFHIFKRLIEKLTEHKMWKWSEIQVSVSINKVLLGHSLHHFLALVSTFTPQRQSSVVVTDCGLKNIKCSLLTPLQKKYADPCDRDNLGWVSADWWRGAHGRPLWDCIFE